MKQKIYNFLVNRHPGIGMRYHKLHDGVSGMKKVFSWLYLFCLNVCYYIFFCRFLDRQPKTAIYEEKRIPADISESKAAAGTHPDIKETVRRLMQYDVICFDIFDTLIFRPFSEPSDVFFFIGGQLGFMDFKRIRILMEAEARTACKIACGHTEIKLSDIWKKIEAETGILAETGIRAELAAESRFCYANPFMLSVYEELKQKQKEIILISDMYLPSAFLKQMLKEKGFYGIDKIFVSCEYGKNKASGNLFEEVKRGLPREKRVIHVGDNPLSDVKMAKKHGFPTFYYPNVNKSTLLYRPYDMSPVIGGAYRGIINNTLYNGYHQYGMEYEYGFVYGGIFVLGYCNFIHEYCRNHEMDKILFFSRDGDILKQVYDRVFPGEDTEYVYWSRTAAAKLMADENKYDYFRRFLYHKVNQNRTLEQILNAMELYDLPALLPAEMQKSDYLTEKNAGKVKIFLEEHWELIRAVYQEQQDAGRDYYANVLSGCKRVCAADIGWAGSGAVSLGHLVQKVWNFKCEVIGLIAGTNTIHNAEPDAGEMFLQTGKLVSYLYSQSHNRDLMKKHDPNRDYNIFWELLLASPTRQFLGFAYEKGTKDVRLCFGGQEVNQKGIQDIQNGILDFADAWLRHFTDRPYMLQISGRDAYAPMLAAAGFHESYLKAVSRKFSFSVGVGE